MNALSIDERVARLERSARRWRLAALVGFAAVAGSCATRDDGRQADVLRVRRVEVLDAAGGAAIVLDGAAPSIGMRARGGSSSFTIDTDGQVELVLGGKGGGLVGVMGPAEKPGAMIAADQPGGFITLYDGQGQSAWQSP